MTIRFYNKDGNVTNSVTRVVEFLYDMKTRELMYGQYYDKKVYYKCVTIDYFGFSVVV